MPNWAYNKITAKTDEDFNALCKKFLDKNENLDFNTIVPMPDTIKNTTGISKTEHMEMIAYVLTHKPDGSILTLNTKDDVIKAIDVHNQGDGQLAEDLTDDDFCAIIESSKRQDDLEWNKQHWDRFPASNEGRSYFTEAENVLYNMLHYGVTNWYDWSINNWGSKWNASSTDVDKLERSIYWETAWSPTVEIAQNMSKVCTEPVYYQYAEEQFTEYVGEFIFHKGDVIKQSENPGGLEQYLLAAELIDPEQNETRYDPKSRQTIFTWDMDPEKMKRLDAKCPAVYQDTSIKRDFINI